MLTLIKPEKNPHHLSAAALLYLFFGFLSAGSGFYGPEFEFFETTEKFPCNALNNIENCAQCIQQHFSCAWCKEPKFGRETNESKCDTIENLVTKGCLKDQIEHPFSQTEWPEVSDLWPISPNNLKVKVRPKQRFRFNVTLRKEKTYPIDLYYLLDISPSMKDDKATIIRLAKDLFETLKNLTNNNHRLAFGSFIDKPTAPFSEVDKCTLEKNCIKPHAFKHHLDFTNDRQKFVDSIENINTYPGTDTQDSGLEALMQVLVCNQQIKWRSNARRIIIYASDSGFHLAGDGKLAAIYEPNDEQCHMTRTPNWRGASPTKFQYDNDVSTRQDYPSFGQLDEKLSESGINVIFAVVKDRLKLFRSLRNEMVSKNVYVSALEGDSKNIIRIIEEEYQKIQASFSIGKRLDSFHDQNDISIQLTTNYALRNYSKTEERTAKFPVEITVHRCPKRSRHIKVVLFPAEFPQETLLVEVEVICDCQCQKFQSVEAQECEYKGDLVCGKCECYRDYYGSQCQCLSDSGDYGHSKDYDKLCINPSSPNQQVCSGSGECACGQCHCEEPPRTPFEEHSPNMGKYCQCPIECPRDMEGYQCGGKHRGVCNCGVCDCKWPWAGVSCDCKEGTDASSCIAAGRKMTCSGNGVCNCGKCQCDLGWSGLYCKICETCPESCKQFDSCVVCMYDKKSNANVNNSMENCNKECSGFQVFYLLEDQLISDVANKSHTNCSVAYSDGCYIPFAYLLHDNIHHVVIQTKLVCISNAALTASLVVLGVILAIVLIGLLALLIYKLCVDCHDRREYARFEEASRNPRFATEQSPLYKPAITEYKNPRYRPSSSRTPR